MKGALNEPALNESVSCVLAEVRPSSREFRLPLEVPLTFSRRDTFLGSRGGPILEASMADRLGTEPPLGRIGQDGFLGTEGERPRGGVGMEGFLELNEPSTEPPLGRLGMDGFLGTDGERLRQGVGMDGFLGHEPFLGHDPERDLIAAMFMNDCAEQRVSELRLRSSEAR